MMTRHGEKRNISAGARKSLVCLLLPLLLAGGYADAAPAPEQPAGAEAVPDYAVWSGGELLYAVRADAQGAELLALIDAVRRFHQCVRRKSG